MWMSPTLGVASMAFGMSVSSALRTILGAITNPARAYNGDDRRGDGDANVRSWF